MRQPHLLHPLPGPFVRHPKPVLDPTAELVWKCPISGRSQPWADWSTCNSAAVVHDREVCLLFRAKPHPGGVKDPHRIGLAVGTDGRSLQMEPEPVLYPDHDAAAEWEWPMGCEDPRCARRDDGLWVRRLTRDSTGARQGRAWHRARIFAAGPNTGRRSVQREQVSMAASGARPVALSASDMATN